MLPGAQQAPAFNVLQVPLCRHMLLLLGQGKAVPGPARVEEGCVGQSFFVKPGAGQLLVVFPLHMSGNDSDILRHSFVQV